MPSLIFQHAKIDRALTVETGANNISWSYNLNTQAYPTYGGEVVQVLSTNIDQMTIQGEVTSYAKMEEIYRWFLEYMGKATQGYGSQEGYNESAVIMLYPHRGWQFSIKPISLPNLRYGRDVVVPQWQMVAHVIVPDPETQQLSIDHGIGSLVGGELANVNQRISADIGFRSQNPFSDPNSAITKEEFQLYYNGDKSKVPEGIRIEGEKVADIGSNAHKAVGKQMSAMFEKLMNGDVESIFGNLTDWIGGEASKPADAQQEEGSADTTGDIEQGPLETDSLPGGFPNPGGG
jgi:hypothetical protein